MKPISIEDAITVQQENLRVWKVILSPSAFNSLESFCKANNETVIVGNDVKRGKDLDDFIFRLVWSMYNENLNEPEKLF